MKRQDGDTRRRDNMHPIHSTASLTRSATASLTRSAAASLTLSAAGPLTLLAAAALILLAGGLAGCSEPHRGMDVQNPDIAAYLRLTIPRTIKMQPSFTRPVSFARDGNADGLEVLLAAEDVFGEQVKTVGAFHFELYTVPTAKGSRLGERIAFWSVKVDSEEGLRSYWDRLSRYFQFPLRFKNPTLAPGRYRLLVRLMTPIGDTLFDEYEFSHEGGTTPSPTISYHD